MSSATEEGWTRKYDFTPHGIDRFVPVRSKSGRADRDRYDRQRIAQFCATPTAWIISRRADRDERASRWDFSRDGELLGVATLSTEDLAEPTKLRRAILRGFPTAVIEANQSEHLRAALSRRLAEYGPGLPVEHVLEHTGFYREASTGRALAFVTRRASIGSAAVSASVHDPHCADLGSEPPDQALVELGVRALLGGSRAYAQSARPIETLTRLATISPVLIREISRSNRAPNFAFIGASGSCKTLTAQRIAGVWSASPDAVLEIASTGASLERSLSIAANQPVCADDFKPATCKMAEVLRFVQSVADGFARGRLSPDGERGREWPPRGVLVLGGEDFIPGELSAVGRLLPAVMRGGQIDPHIFMAETAAETPAMRAALSAYLEWLVQHHESALTDAQTRLPHLKSELQRMVPNAAHERFYENGALAVAAFAPFVMFAGHFVPIDVEATIAATASDVAQLINDARSLADDSRIGVLVLRDIIAAWRSGKVIIRGLPGPKEEESDNAPILGTAHGDFVFISPHAFEQTFPTLLSNGSRSKWSTRAIGEDLEACGYLGKREAAQRTVKAPDGARSWAFRVELFIEDDGDVRESSDG